MAMYPRACTDNMPISWTWACYWMNAKVNQLGFEPLRFFTAGPVSAYMSVNYHTLVSDWGRDGVKAGRYLLVIDALLELRKNGRQPTGLIPQDEVSFSVKDLFDKVVVEVNGFALTF